MSYTWHASTVALKSQISAATVVKGKFSLLCRKISPAELESSVDFRTPPKIALASDHDGYLLRAAPVPADQRRFALCDDFVVYVPYIFERYFLNLKQSFGDYQTKFSSKTRSTLNRKVKRFASFCGGTLDFRIFRSVSEAHEFYRYAREVSHKSYQERLLHVGLPDSAEFGEQLKELAVADAFRGYLLFHNAKPVSYLYLSAQGDTLDYQHLGFDPSYADWSVGTILHWKAVESLCAEQKFSVLDFDEGGGLHKQTFGTHSYRCGNIFFLRNNVVNIGFVFTHILAERTARLGMRMLDQLGLRSKLRRFIRNRA